MTASCWSLGSALYFLAVWRWRVAHFDAQNDITTAHHVAGLKMRLRHGHLDITRDYTTPILPSLQNKLSRSICAMLGGDWTGLDGTLPRHGHCYLVAFAGGASGASTTGSSGTVVVKVHLRTGTHAVQYVSSVYYKGAHLVPLRATQLGLLRGLRRCYSHHWGPVYVTG
ncbi:hypothetical protein PR003_g32096, partial [Phytophthora rubi]